MTERTPMSEAQVANTTASAMPSSPSVTSRTAPVDLLHLTRGWGTEDSVSLYLQRCQVETPSDLVRATWRHVHDFRKELAKVVDFGAGNGRFAHYGNYREYIGYEIDGSLIAEVDLPQALGS
jgi:hypothetical protein